MFLDILSMYINSDEVLLNNLAAELIELRVREILHLLQLIYPLPLHPLSLISSPLSSKIVDATTNIRRRFSTIDMPTIIVHHPLSSFAQVNAFFLISVFAGTRDLSGPRTGSLGRDLDLDLDPRIRASQPPPFTDPLLAFDDEDTMFDSRGQRISRRSRGDDFADEVAATTRRFRARVAAIGFEDEIEAANVAGQARRNQADLLENAVTARKGARAAIEDVESSFKRRSKLLDESERADEVKSALTRWSRFNEDDDLAQTSAAASRAMQTKARLHDIESEMEELAEKQAKRERRAAALRALINETAASDADVVQQSAVSKKVRIAERAEHVSF